MLYTSESTGKPARVTLEVLPEGGKRVLLTDNVKKVVREEPGPENRTSTAYQYDVVCFYLPEDRQDETAKTIESSFSSWWEYGKTPQEKPTLEDRVAALEALAMA